MWGAGDVLMAGGAVVKRTVVKGGLDLSAFAREPEPIRHTVKGRPTGARRQLQIASLTPATLIEPPRR